MNVKSVKRELKWISVIFKNCFIYLFTLCHYKCAIKCYLLRVSMQWLFFLNCCCCCLRVQLPSWPFLGAVWFLKKKIKFTIRGEKSKHVYFFVTPFKPTLNPLINKRGSLKYLPNEPFWYYGGEHISATPPQYKKGSLDHYFIYHVVRPSVRTFVRSYVQIQNISGQRYRIRK